MFENLKRIAERAATGVSRRQFLNGLARTAVGAAAGVAGVLAMSQPVQAGRGISRKRCCGRGRSCPKPAGKKGCRYLGCRSEGGDCVWSCKEGTFSTSCVASR